MPLTVPLWAHAYAPGLESQQPTGIAEADLQVVEGIEAATDVHGFIDRVRAALGGERALAAVNSLLIEGTRAERPFTYRVLLPDRFQWYNSGPTFTIDGPSRYVQRPDVSANVKATSSKNARKTFVTICLTTLFRAPSLLKVRATLRAPDPAGTTTLVFTTAGGFAVQLEVNTKTFLPTAYSYIDNLTEGNCGEPPVTSSASRRVVFDDFKQVAGIRFPVMMSDTVTAADSRTFTSSLQFTTVRVNEGVSQADFEK